MRPERRLKRRNGRGRLRPARILNQTRRSVTYCGRKMVLTMGATLHVAHSPPGVAHKEHHRASPLAVDAHGQGKRDPQFDTRPLTILRGLAEFQNALKVLKPPNHGGNVNAPTARHRIALRSGVNRDWLNCLSKSIHRVRFLLPTGRRDSPPTIQRPYCSPY